MLNVAAIEPCTAVEGPGRRTAIWLQGCHKRCVQCCNPQMLQLRPNRFMSEDELVEAIEQAYEKYAIEGITLLGGEPLLQAGALAAVARRTRELGLTVMVFTGYEWSEVRSVKLPGVDHLLKQIDVVVSGPYEHTSPDHSRNWVGSTNQVFHYLTSAYDAQIETMATDERELEIRVGLDGKIRLNGFPLVRI